MSAPATRGHLREVRAAAVPQRLRATTGENAYAIYIAFLVLIILTSPYYAAVTGLTHPDVRPLLLSDLAPRVATIVGWTVLAGAVVAGRIRGPVHLAPFLAALIGSGPWPRRLALLRPYLRSLAVLVLSLAAVAPAPAIALVVVGRPVTDAVMLVLAAVLLGLVAGILWLAGQALPRGWSAAFSLLLVALAPWAPMPLVGLGAAALAGGYAVPHLLDRLTGPGLLEQAVRWESAGVAATTGDLAAAASHLRRPPSLGASWSAIGWGSWLPVVFWRRDLIGSLRDPERFVLGALGLVTAGALGAAAGAMPGSSRWAVLAASVAVAYLGAGVWSDGYRHVVETTGAPTLYGRSTAYLLLLHSLLPVTLVVLLGGAGTALVARWLPVTAPVVAVAVLGMLLALGARVQAAAQGPLPLALLTPVPTPMGDLSGLNVALWQVKSLLLAGLAATSIGNLALGGSPWWLLAYLPVVWLLVRKVTRPSA